MKRIFVGPHRFIHGDCLEVMPELLEGSVDLVLTDPPYGTTACKWDAVIPFEQMWDGVKHCLKSNGATVLTASQPFTSALVISQPKFFKYSLVWDKVKGTGFLNAKRMPMRNHEDVLVFYGALPTYNPQKTSGHERKKTFRSKDLQTDVYGNMAGDYHYDSSERYPRSIMVFSTDTHNSSLHPTQKPVALMEYLIRTYTNEGETVLDFTMGSGTTGIACQNTGRKFIGIEKDDDYFQIAVERNQKWMDEATTRDSQGDLF